MPETELQRLDAPDFLHRILRLLAILCIGYGSFRLISFVVALAAYGAGVWPMYYGYARRNAWFVQYSLSAIQLSCYVLMAVGGFGLLKWKSWGRRILTLWAALDILFGFATGALWYFDYASSWAATTQPASPSMFMMGWFLLASTLERTPLPLTVLLILLHREVAKLWPGRSGSGFEVVPFATPVKGDTQ